MTNELSIRDFLNKNDIPYIYTYYHPKSLQQGKKIPCYLSCRDNPNHPKKYTTWDREEISKHNKWIQKEHPFADRLMVRLDLVDWICIDTDSIKAEEFVSKLGKINNFDINDCPTTKSQTKEYGRHRYIKLEVKDHITYTNQSHDLELDIIGGIVVERLNRKVVDKEQQELTEEQVAKILEIPYEQLQKKSKAKLKYNKKDNEGYKGYEYNVEVCKKKKEIEESNIDFDRLKEMISYLNPNEFRKYSEWFKFITLIYNQSNGGEEKYFDLINPFLSKMEGWNGDQYEYENYSTWKKLKTTEYDGKSIGIGTLYFWLKRDAPNFLQEDNDRGTIDMVKFNQLKNYSIQKEYFEKYCFQIKGTKPCYVEEDDEDPHERYKYRDRGAFQEVFQELNSSSTTIDKKGKVGEIDEPFTALWLKDPNKRFYKRMNFTPPPMKCNEKFEYNLFDGLECDKYDFEWEEGEDDTYKMSLLTDLLQHIFYISGEDLRFYKFLIKLFAHRLLFPSELPKVSLVLISKEGAGKNMLFDWFGKMILGSKYYISTARHESFFGRFNNQIKGKLMVVCNEMTQDCGYRNDNRMKEFITDEWIDNEIKFGGTERIRNCGWFNFFSNQPNPVRIDANGSRRYAVQICSDKVFINKSEYFSNLRRQLEDIKVIMAFVWFLRNKIPNITKGMDFSTMRPITKAYKDLQRKNLSLLDRWLEFVVGHLEKVGKQCIKYDKHSLYLFFKDWLEDTHSRCVKHSNDFMIAVDTISFLDTECNVGDYREKCIRKVKNSTYKYELDATRIRDYLHNKEIIV